MQFPDWVEQKQTALEKAEARLRFMMTNIAIQQTGKGTLRAFAELVGIDHSTLAYSLKRGYCTSAVATRIEDKLGREIAPNEHFRKPLEIA